MFFDGHGDILTDVMEQMRDGIDIWQDYHKERYEKAGIKGGIFVNFTDPQREDQLKEFTEINETSVPYFKQRKDFNIIYNENDWDINKFNLIFGIEGANAINSPDELDTLYQMGYRHIGFTWNEKNKFATGTFESGGITSLGKDAIEKAESLGMVIDYAHLNEQSFYEMAKLTKKPIFVSHANVRSLCNHPRNLTDEQLKLVKLRNGVVGLAGMRFFLREDKENATIDDLINHIVYMRENIGIDHVALGLDFCYYLGSHQGQNKVEGLRHIDDIQVIPKLLKERGLSKTEIEKICFKNMLRVINDNLKI